MKIAILDDYQHVALTMADWSSLADCQIDVFGRHLSEQETPGVLAPYDALCVMRERMPLPASLLAQLPNLRLIVTTGAQNRSIDLDAASKHGILVTHTGSRQAGGTATPELAWGLLLALARHIPFEETSMRQGGWQTTVGTVLDGKILGLLGLGRIGRKMAAYGQVFGMQVIAWSQNLTPEAARESNVTRVEKDELFQRSDALSIHLVLSERTRGLVGAHELALMKPAAMLVNTSRGPIVDEAELIALLRRRGIAGAALDVYDIEPLPADHILRHLDNVVLSPHIGYVAVEAYQVFFANTVENLNAYRAGAPIRVLNAKPD